MIFESHAHFEDEQFDHDRRELLLSLEESGIGYVVNVSSSLSTIEKTLALTREYPFIYGSVGVHPEECAQLNEETIKWVEEMLHQPKVVSLGEIGLDYYWDQPERPIQKKWFECQIELAKKAGLPMIIHSRDAARDTLDIIKGCNGQMAGGVIHCFSYGIEIAREYLNMGFYLGIGGVLTFSNAKKLKEVAAYAPLDRILLETDCPYLAPIPNRGKRNSSLNLTYIVKELAKLRGIPEEEVIRVTEENARTMYRL